MLLKVNIMMQKLLNLLSEISLFLLNITVSNRIRANDGLNVLLVYSLNTASCIVIA